MSMETTYAAKILEEILIEFLKAGTIPTADQLQEAYEARLADHKGGLDSPFILDDDHSVDTNSESSAAAYNTFLARTKSDLEAVYLETWERMGDGMESFESWRMKLDSLLKRIINLEERIDNLLLLRNDTDGYFAFVEERFVDMSQVDQDNSTADIDVVNHVVTIGVDTADLDKLDLNAFQSRYALFTILTRESIESAQAAPGTEVRSVIRDVGRVWQHRARTSTANSTMSGELKIRLTQPNTTTVALSKMLVEVHASNTNSPVLLTAQYSVDGYNWYNLPTDNYVQSTDDTAVFLFPATEMNWMKLVMTKTGADSLEDGQYIYEFGAKNISFWSHPGYVAAAGDSLASIELSATDVAGELVSFNKVALATCQEVPENTGIKYWVSAIGALGTTEPMRIDPYTIAGPLQPTVVDFGNMVTTEESGLTILDRAESESVDFFTAYDDFVESDKLVLVGLDTDTGLYVDSATAARTLDHTIAFYRNVGDNGGTADEALADVRGAPRGWEYDETGTYLQTTIVIENEDGLTVDLGDSPAIIDGAARSNEYTIPKGVHSFKTLVTNTSRLTTYPSEGFELEEEIEQADPLYPFNHKLVVEGIVYKYGYVGDKRYLGADLYCQKGGGPLDISGTIQRVSIFDLMHNVEEIDYSRFAVDTAADGSRVFVARFDPEDDDLVNERFALSYSTGDNMFDRVVLTAQLETDDSSRTPSLTAYRIKLGA